MRRTLCTAIGPIRQPTNPLKQILLYYLSVYTLTNVTFNFNKTKAFFLNIYKSSYIGKIFHLPFTISMPYYQNHI